jgi:hypothetical protein
MILDSTNTNTSEGVMPPSKSLGKVLEFPNITTSDVSVKENTFEANEFPVTINVPIYIEPGEKVTVRIIREKTEGLQTIFNDSTDMTKGVNESNFSDLYNITTGIVKTNLDTPLSDSDNIVSNTDSKESVLTMAKQTNPLIILLTKVQNIAIAVGFFTAFIFLVLSFTQTIQVLDGIFAILMSSAFGFIMLFDKYYRRSLNSAESN